MGWALKPGSKVFDSIAMTNDLFDFGYLEIMTLFEEEEEEEVETLSKTENRNPM